MKKGAFLNYGIKKSSESNFKYCTPNSTYKTPRQQLEGESYSEQSYTKAQNYNYLSPEEQIPYRYTQEKPYRDNIMSRSMVQMPLDDIIQANPIKSLSLIHICRCRRYAVCRSRWSPYH
eukprot:TRINITY_DN8281_c0_g1_i2.p1 TRINITY_DN8281_c0_g1~~TRINITY_DN8281_c0_g1_i2.p1  ORF type:complete len:133 (-),score=15.14 TRINITY_DN8281_c0_g1_i2:23-379(-)